MQALPVPEWLKKTGKSVLRIVVALALLLGLPALCYLVWQPPSVSRPEGRPHRAL